ncbi:MAG: tRNA 4-thiouridine(8) synthase ThiI [Candidatus Peribacteraceae bacterium]|nr:tRNA 4-thiouridine(8) synthase ThiI [Candidatus Peribacteraceae bacterium]
MKKVFIAKYGELWLKSEPVKKQFATKLANNVKSMLERRGIKSNVHRFRDMIAVESENPKVADVLSKTFGISWFSYATEVESNLKSMEKIVLKFAKEIKPEQTFAIRASRQNKQLPFTSMQIENEMGKLVDRKVNLSNPDFTIFIEANKDRAYVFSEKMRGPGGLPYGVSGKLVSMISGGIDSPVASWFMMKRGCSVDFINFSTDDRSSEKVKHLVQKLGEYAPDKLNFHVVPYKKVLEAVSKYAEIKLTCVFCKRLMYKISEKFAGDVKAKAIVTGENLGQVASQTLDNLSTNTKAVDIPVLRPLIGMDKQDTIELAKKIGTFDMSIDNVKPCKFVPKGPATKSTIEKVDEEEKKIKDLSRILRKSIDDSERLKI